MPKNYKYVCPCGWSAVRYRNMRRCPNCGAAVLRLEGVESAQEPQEPSKSESQSQFEGKIKG